MKIGVVGSGAVGRRVLRQLPDAEYISSQALVSSGAPASFSGVLSDFDAILLTNESTDQLILAGMAVAEGVSVITTADTPDTVSGLFKLDTLAKDRGVSLIVGAAYSPGLSCVLAAYLAGFVDKLTEIHIARAGTGGPCCARNYHRALGSTGVEYYEGAWRRRPGGSGRELYFFPEPLGGADCYAGALPEPLILARSFSEARRITAKRAATRRDRFTSPFPMMRPPHREGSLGGVRVAIRGIQGGEFTELTAASVALPAMAAASVLVASVSLFRNGMRKKTGAVGLAEAVSSPKEFLHELVNMGVGIYRFTGSEAS